MARRHYPDAAADELMERYRDLLQGSYDCVDRIVLNAYNSLCYSAGGFRQWWRRAHADAPFKPFRSGGSGRGRHLSNEDATASHRG
jgi:hypothetical protein